MKLFSVLIYNVMRICLLKLRFGSRASVHWIQRISPSCALHLYEKGHLYIGRNCQFEAGCDLQVHGTGRLTIGQRVYMNRYCMVSVHGLVEIGDHCIFGPGVKIFDNNHRFTKSDGASPSIDAGSIKIGKNCWIASNAIILKGAEIGNNCVIRAGCIIKDTIPAGSLVRPNCNHIIEPIRS